MAEPALYFIGEIDISTLPGLTSSLGGLVVGSGDVHLDLSGVSFVDARGVAAFVEFAERLAPSSSVVLHGVPRVLTRILDLLWPDGTALLVAGLQPQRPPAVPPLDLTQVSVQAPIA